jgi:hypothetical protein
MNKKKRIILFVLVIILAFIAVAMFISNTTNTFNKSESNFAIKDSSTVTRIFLTDKSNNKIELIKEKAGHWIVNNKYDAINDAVNLLLKTMTWLDVRAKVPKSEHDNVVSRMAAIGVKVEIYQNDYRIFINDNLKYFPYEKLSKVYYVGDATKDNLGTYMLMEGAAHPYIIQIRGFNGFLFTRYSTKEEDWREHSIFNYRLAEIKNIVFEVPENPEQSWLLKNPDNRNFELFSLHNNKIIENIDTMRVLEYLGSFGNVKFEIFLNDMEQNIKDSIINSQPWHIMTITDVYGKTSTIKTFHKRANQGEEDYEGNPILWDRDRLYALVNNEEDFVMIQFFIFDRILRPIDYFRKDDN